jgi:hypothetical protein
MMRALQAMMLGPIGQQNVQVAGTDVPVDAFANLLGALGQQAQTEFSAVTGAPSEGMPEYLVESTGEYRCDPADPAQRAEVLWELLQTADANAETLANGEQLDEADLESDESDESDSDSEAAFYDSLELEELEAEYEEAF